MVNKEAYERIIEKLNMKNAVLVAVSKTKPADAITELYDLGQRDFGENYVQELVEKQTQLPQDVQWHFIGHLQTNKVKYIAPFVHLIHGVDSFKLLKEINKQGEKNNRIISCLLQVYIAQEETKFGLDDKELDEIMKQLITEPLPHIKIAGLMGMASFTDDINKVRAEFKHLKSLFNQYNLQILSMGMSADYKIAIEEGSTLVRIGSLLFGQRR